MFSVISHDLKNPFSSVLHFSNILLDDVDEKELGEEEKYDMSKRINKSSKNIVHLVNNLLDWSQLESDHINHNTTSFALDKLIEENINIYYSTASTKMLTVNNTEQKEFEIRAVRYKVNAIIRNLLNNAIKFSPNDKTIEFFDKEFPDKYLISVKEQGVGLTDEQIQNIFGNEETKSTFGTKDEPGTGLGIGLCLEFVRAHGGELWAERNPDVGISMCFTISK